MKTAALLTGNKGKYFKVAIKDDNSVLRKLRIIRGVRRTGLHTFNVPFGEDTIDFLTENQFEFNGAFNKMQELEKAKRNPIKKIPKYKKRKLKPYDYQLEGVNFIEYHNGRALIADVMGLGKTIQALAWIQYRKDLKSILIVCPASLKINWKEEFEKWVTRDYYIEILEGTTPYEIKGDVVIANYDILHSWVIDLKLTNFDVCIADELHYVKSTKSLRTKAFKEIVMMIPNVIGLTGTPIENDPIEIFYLVNLINKNVFPNYIKFIERYYAAKQVDQDIRGGKLMKETQPDGTVKEIWKHNTRKVWKRGKAQNQKELHRILKNHVMIRRTFQDVNLQLPDKIYSNIHLSIDNADAYYKAEEDFIEYVKEKFDKRLLDNLSEFEDEEQLKLAKIEKLDAISRAPALAMLQELKLLAAKGKIKQVIDWIHDFLDTDEKLIVFAINKIIVKKLMDAFPDAVKIDGSTSSVKRNEAVKSFQNDSNVKLFIGNIKAAGIGLTLTAASKVAIVQFPWNPGEMLQAEGRSLRIGQTKKVTVYKFIAKDTIEDRIIKLLNFKQNEIDQIIDGKDVKYKQDLVKLLIKSYQK